MTGGRYDGEAIAPNLSGSRCEPKKVQVWTETVAAMRVARSLWPDKTVQHLIEFTGASESTADRWLRGTHEMSLVHFMRLARRSGHAGRFLDAAMGDECPAEWRVVRLIFGAAVARRVQLAMKRKLAREISGAFDAEKELSAVIAQAESLAAGDADFHSPSIDAFRGLVGAQVESAGVSHRPGNQTRGKR